METKVFRKVFRVEILKPANYTWQDFNTLVNKINYWSAQLANQVVLEMYLKAKASDSLDLDQNAYKKAKDNLSSRVRDAVLQQARLLFVSNKKQIMRADKLPPMFCNNTFWLRESGLILSRNNNGDWIARLNVLPGKNQKQPEVILKTRAMKRNAPGYYQILERIASGKYRQGFTQVKRDKNRNKLYLLINYSFEPNHENGLNANRIMGVDLGVSTPAYCAFNDSLKRANFIVEGRKLLRVKNQIQRRQKHMQRELGLRDTRRGHGLGNKFSPMREIQDKWDNFRRTWNHTLAKRIVDFAVKNKAGVIHLEDLSPEHDSKFLGKEWPVAELLNFIEYKAENQGISVKRVNPYKTSQTCSRCGCIAENFTFNNRKKGNFPSFICQNCGFQDNADYNAAKNIAHKSF